MIVGILGGGQLGRMLTLAGYPLGMQSICFDEVDGTSASFTGRVDTGSLTDIAALESWAKQCDVLTYEFENFPAALVGHLAEVRPLFPGVQAIAVAQNRWQEKSLFDDLDIPVPPFRFASSEAEVLTACDELDFPVVAKTRTGGYDGKGQAVVRSAADIPAAVALLEHSPVIVEQFVDLITEVSVIGVRARNGDVAFYPLAENHHVDGVLRTSIAPAAIDPAIVDDAHHYIERILKKLDYVGVLALELFVTPAGLLANEMAPRVHNSGHWTINGAATSQFENHMRAVVGMPLGSTELLCPSAMVNFIGSVPDTDAVVRIPGTHLHLYDKSDRPGRKVGHVNITAPDEIELSERLAAVQSLL